MYIQDIWENMDYIVDIVKQRKVVVIGNSQIEFNTLLYLNKVGVEISDILEELPSILNEDVLYLVNMNDRENVYYNENIIGFNFHRLEPKIMKAENLYIYGAGSSGKRTLKIFSENNIKVQGFLDSNMKKSGNLVDGIVIKHPMAIQESITLVISTQYYKEIYGDLKKYNLDIKDIYVDYANSLNGSKQPLYYNSII